MSADDAFVLAPAWRAWIAENLARGVAPREVRAQLVAAGLDEDLVALEVAALVVPTMLAHGSRLRRLLGRSIPDGASFPTDFWTHHWEGNLPFVARGYARRWPALNGWTFDRLRERFGPLPLAVEVEREPQRHFEGRWIETTFEAFLDRMQGAPGNDTYAIARNENLRRAELASLFLDIVVDASLFDPTRLVGGSSLWLGPAGTLTPLHFDTTNILFVQMRGRKRFQLVPPDTTELLLHLDGFYVVGDLDRVAPDDVHTFVLEPGDALFIPVGWFHRVAALDASISFSLLCFRRNNDFSPLAAPLAAVRSRVYERRATPPIVK